VVRNHIARPKNTQFRHFRSKAAPSKQLLADMNAALDAARRRADVAEAGTCLGCRVMDFGLWFTGLRV